MVDLFDRQGTLSLLLARQRTADMPFRDHCRNSMGRGFMRTFWGGVSGTLYSDATISLSRASTFLLAIRQRGVLIKRLLFKAADERRHPRLYRSSGRARNLAAHA